jgi:hypothetical protein
LLLDSGQKFHGTWYSGCCRSNCHFFIYNCCHTVNNFAAILLVEMFFYSRVIQVDYFHKVSFAYTLIRSLARKFYTAVRF